MTAEAARVAIVTGASRGLGLAMARGLAGAGLAVVLTASADDGALAAAAQGIDEGLGRPRTLALRADVTSASGCEGVVRQALERFGRLDVLVNNAGRGMRTVSPAFMTEPTRFWQVEPDTWRRLIDTNVNGPFLMARAAVPHLIAAGWGRIVNVSMNRATIVRQGFSPYGPSKAALEAETAIWAKDLAGSGVTVNALLPGGATLTGMIPEGTPEAVRQGLLAPEVIVPPLLWLVSSAADGVTGKRLVGSAWTAEPDRLEDAG